MSSLFAAVLGVNPIGHLLAARGALTALPAADRQALTGREFFPGLISGPFHHGLIVVFAFAAALSALAALASSLRGARPGAADTASDARPGAADTASDAHPGAADTASDARPGAADTASDAHPGRISEITKDPVPMPSASRNEPPG